MLSNSLYQALLQFKQFKDILTQTSLFTKNVISRKNPETQHLYDYYYLHFGRMAFSTNFKLQSETYVNAYLNIPKSLEVLHVTYIFHSTWSMP